MAAHHRVHDYACCHLQADCLESGISYGPLRSITSMGTFTFTVSGDCDVFTASWKQLKVDGAQKSSVVIPHLDADEVYCVKMKSVSSPVDSRYTVPLKHRVFRTGSDVRIYFVSSNVMWCYM